jgi:RNA polymerase sigma-70 factor (ECF subfamily)
VQLRFDPKLQSRVDPSDVVQETMLEAAQRIDEYIDRSPMPFWLWLRLTVCDRLIELRRQHLGAACRDVGREIRLPEASSVQIGGQLLGGDTPSNNAARRELADRVRRAVDRLDDDDRAIILLRNFEELTNVQAAEVLGIEPAAASKRFGRALLKLKDILGSESRL